MVHETRRFLFTKNLLVALGAPNVLSVVFTYKI